MNDRVAIGIDVGGTKTSAARVGSDGRVIASTSRPTPADDMQATLHTLVEVARAVVTPGIEGVGVAAAGMVERSTGILRFAPNLAWRDAPLVAYLQQALELPVVAENDNTAAAWGEYRFGAGRGYRDMLLVGVGTGIGGGIIADGRLLRGANGFAAEIGHIVMDANGPLCGCGNRGCWEQFASGRAVTRAGRRAVHDGFAGLLVERTGGDADKIDGPMVTAAAHDGDSVACEILAEVGTWLGLGIGGLVNILDPQVVVVAGGVASAGDLLLEPARAAFHETVEGMDHRPGVPIVAGELGEHTGVIGAAGLVLEPPP